MLSLAESPDSWSLPASCGKGMVGWLGVCEGVVDWVNEYDRG